MTGALLELAREWLVPGLSAAVAAVAGLLGAWLQRRHAEAAGRAKERADQLEADRKARLASDRRRAEVATLPEDKLRERARRWILPLLLLVVLAGCAAAPRAALEPEGCSWARVPLGEAEVLTLRPEVLGPIVANNEEGEARGCWPAAVGPRGPHSPAGADAAHLPGSPRGNFRTLGPPKASARVARYRAGRPRASLLARCPQARRPQQIPL